MKDYNNAISQVGTAGETLVSGTLVDKGYAYEHFFDTERQVQGTDGVLTKDGVSLLVDVKSDQHVGYNNILFELLEVTEADVKPGWYYYSKADAILFVNQTTKRIFLTDMSCRKIVDNVLSDAKYFPGVWISRDAGTEGQTMFNLIIPQQYLTKYITEL